MIAALLCLGSTQSARADFVLWYGGDLPTDEGLRNGFANGTNIGFTSETGNAAVYEDFNVGAGGATITSVFSNNLMNFRSVTQAQWEIRSGVSAGNGGTLIASGLAAATQTLTGRQLIDPVNGNLDEFTIQVDGLNVALGAGTYWVSVVPIGPTGLTGLESFVSNTIGENGVGTPIDNQNAFFNATSPSNNFSFEPITDLFAVPPLNFSLGVIAAASAVPVPPSAILLTLGAIGMIGYRRWRTI